MSVRAAVVGLGVMGRNHLRILAQLPGVEVVAAHDSDAGAAAAAEAAGVPAVADLDAVAGARPDLVVVAVPTSAHLGVARALARDGVTLLVEKPLAASVDEGRALLDAARAAGARVGVGHVERFNPVVTALRDLLAAGQVGALRSLSARRLGPFPPRIRDVGVIVDLATHDLDIVTTLHPAPVARLQAETVVPDGQTHEHHVTALLRFADGVLATVEASWLPPTKTRELAVTGERGMLVADYLSQHLTFVRRSASARPLGTSAQYQVERDLVELSLVRAEPLRLELEAVIAAVSGERELPVSGEDGLRVLALAEAVRAAASGAPVT